MIVALAVDVHHPFEAISYMNFFHITWSKMLFCAKATRALLLFPDLQSAAAAACAGDEGLEDASAQLIRDKRLTSKDGGGKVSRRAPDPSLTLTKCFLFLLFSPLLTHYLTDTVASR